MQQMKESERVFLREFLIMMKGGFKLIKHGKRGTTSARTLLLSADEQEISWETRRRTKRGNSMTPSPADSDELAKGPEKDAGSNCVRVSDIQQVRRDLPPKHTVPSDRTKCCFTLVTRSRTVILETIDPETRELIADGFHLLLQYRGLLARVSTASAIPKT